MRSRVSDTRFREMVQTFTALLESGQYPLSQILTTTAQQQRSRILKSTLLKVHDIVMQGYPLSHAMANFPDVFDRDFVALVRQGERGGNLDEQLRDYLAKAG